ncbi:hypothetical protein FOZ62_027397 [Perkinsus olseni]|uniref:DEK-C domain-containing protein n=1 Tax=Perkinsus olseni TaxID=32597 RepID=A0A7J6TV37_PEROL|nr:hypothetical protein FOZ62_027397 [Perkinsus olseni]
MSRGTFMSKLDVQFLIDLAEMVAGWAGNAYEVVEGAVYGLLGLMSNPRPLVEKVAPLLRAATAMDGRADYTAGSRLAFVTTLHTVPENQSDILTALAEKTKKVRPSRCRVRELLDATRNKSAEAEDARWIHRDWLDYSVELLLLLCGKSKEWLRRLRPPCRESLVISARLESDLRDPHWELLYLLSLRDTNSELYQQSLTTCFDTTADSYSTPISELTEVVGAPDDAVSWIVEVLVENVAELPVTAVEAVVRKTGLISQMDPASSGSYLGLQRRERLVIFPSRWESLSLSNDQEDRVPYVHYLPLMDTSEESSPVTASSSSEAPGEVGRDTLQSAVVDLVASSDLESVSLRELRRLLEKKLALPDLALDKQKKIIKEMVGEAIAKDEPKEENKVKAEVAVKRERQDSPRTTTTRKRVKKSEKTEDVEASSPSASSSSRDAPSASSEASSDDDSDSASSAPARQAAPKRRARSRTPPPGGLTKKSFERKAKPLKLTLGRQNIDIPARVFKTGSCGWWGRTNIKVPVGKNKVMASCQFQIIVQKSKEWPEK